MDNLERTRDCEIGVALPVPATAFKGGIYHFGNGLRGVLLTDRATTDTIADGTSAPGLKNGQATVELIGVHKTVKVQFAAAIAQFAPVYVDADGNYTATATNNTKVGNTLEALTAAGWAEVALY